jgi:hypothetical protein
MLWFSRVRARCSQDTQTCRPVPTPPMLVLGQVGVPVPGRARGQGDLRRAHHGPRLGHRAHERTQVHTAVGVEMDPGCLSVRKRMTSSLIVEEYARCWIAGKTLLAASSLVSE